MLHYTNLRCTKAFTLCYVALRFVTLHYNWFLQGAWTGLEYEFAGLCLYEGLNDIALRGLTIGSFFQ